MAPFRGGRGTRSAAGSRGRKYGRVGRVGRGGRGGRGGAGDGRKLARSGIRTRSGYRRFDSQRVKNVESESDDNDVSDAIHDDESEDGDLDDEELDESEPQVPAYNTLLQSFKTTNETNGRKAKRPKLDVEQGPQQTAEYADNEEEEIDVALDETEANEAGDDAELPEGAEDQDELDDDEVLADPFEVHFANPDDNELSRRLASIQANNWRTEKKALSAALNISASGPHSSSEALIRNSAINTPSDIPLKKRLVEPATKTMPKLNSLQRDLAPYLTNYSDIVYGARTPDNAVSLRRLACLHALNHVLKGRDKVLKNNERLAKASSADDLDMRDQGFTRPKVLILTETRQMCYEYGLTLAKLFEPDQQENRQRFDSSFSAQTEDERDMPPDFEELFAGNNDNNFMTAIKLTRKTLKFFSAFYTSDIILASPLGLRRILENEDPKKQDHDFLSSIEVLITDQADAMQMQNWTNVESVFVHLNLQLKEAHGCDFSRVRSYYLDGNAKYLRQNIVFAAYVTPEMNRLYNNYMLNSAGKVKFSPSYPNGAINTISNTGGIKQTFSRFDSSSPASDPDARFKYFITAILPSLLRLPKRAEGGQGVLLFIPTYYDFLRIRNYFATSQQTQNISFGTIHEYSKVSDQRRARAHFTSGRHAFLLYTQRAHHFFRLRLKGVRRVVMYGLPDNPIFYEEIGGFLETSLQEGKVADGEAAVRTTFSKWDGLALEKVVGSQRVKSMLAGNGDTFEFV